MSLADTSLALANACDHLSEWITGLRNGANWQETDDQGAKLDQVQSSLGDEADALRTAGVSALLEGSTAALNQINSAVTQIQTLNQQIAQFNQIVSLVTTVVALAGNAASGNLSGIVNGAVSVISQIQKL